MNENQIPFEPPVCILAGPTGVGKTDLAVSLALAWNTDIISADSMQVYRQLSIGTARPTLEELKGVTCHLAGFQPLESTFDVAGFITGAETIIESLRAQNKRPLIVGGTGFYIRGLLHGLFENAPRHDDIRAGLNERVEKEGPAVLHRELEGVDPAAAARIKPGDRYRIVRALEVYYSTGAPISAHHARHHVPRYRHPHVLVVVTRDRDDLYGRINTRVERMMHTGLLDEVRDLVQEGYDENLHPLRALGYRELMRALKGEIALKEAVEEMKKLTRRFAKRQLTWFRGMKSALWINVTGRTLEQALLEIRSAFEKKENIHTFFPCAPGVSGLSPEQTSTKI